MALSCPARRRLVTGTAVGIPLAIIAVAYVVNCWRAHAILQREIAVLRKRGEPVRFVDFAPPPDVEATARGAAAARQLNAFERIPWEHLDRSIAHTLTSEEATQLRQLIDGYRGDLQAFLDLLRQGDCRFDCDYRTPEPYAILLTHAHDVRNAQRLLLADFHVCLRLGERRQAVQRLHDLLDLDRVLRRDAFCVQQRIRVAIAKAALDGLQTALAHQALSEQDLPALRERLQEMESGFRLAHTVRMERAVALAMMENLGRQTMTTYLQNAARGISPSKAAALNYWWGSWAYRPRRLYQEALMLRITSEWAGLVDQPGRIAAQRLAATLDAFNEEACPVFFECCYYIPGIRDVGLGHRQRLIAADFALMVYGFRAAHGRLPQSLEDSAKPPFKEPIGLFTDEPLVYERTPDGFAIYDKSAEQGRFEVKFARHGNLR